MIDKRNFKVQTKEIESVFKKEFIIIRLEHYRIGIQINYLREVFDLKNKKDVIAIPYTPSFIKGIVKVRGEVLPVISLLEVLGTGEREEHCQKVAVIEEKLRLAFLFSEVLDVQWIDDKNIEPVKDATKRETTHYLTGQFTWENEKVRTLDVYKLFSSDLF
jgi:purine-binding chemotaxis protein CheW